MPAPTRARARKQVRSISSSDDPHPNPQEDEGFSEEEDWWYVDGALVYCPAGTVQHYVIPLSNGLEQKNTCDPTSTGKPSFVWLSGQK